MSKTAVFPGSFDPVTLGHESVMKRALPLFDKIIIALGENTGKQHFFSLEKRKKWLEKTFSENEKVEIKTYCGLTVDFCAKQNANYILRGLRTAADFEFERAIAQMNRSMHPQIETVFILALPEFSHIASTIVRDVIKNKGSVRNLVPSSIRNDF